MRIFSFFFFHKTLVIAAYQFSCILSLGNFKIQFKNLIKQSVSVTFCWRLQVRKVEVVIILISIANTNGAIM